MTTQLTGRISGAPEFDGWHYQLVLDDATRQFTISDGSVLVVAWPAGVGHRPLPARLLYVPPRWLEAGRD
jgi:hypothetical protein